MSRQSSSGPSTATRLRQEISELENLIREIQSKSAGGTSQRWYLQMLTQSLVRKQAALEYIENQHGDMSRSDQSSPGRQSG